MINMPTETDTRHNEKQDEPSFDALTGHDKERWKVRAKGVEDVVAVENYEDEENS